MTRNCASYSAVTPVSLMMRAIFAAFRVDEGAELIDRHRLDVGAGFHQPLLWYRGR